MPSSPALLHAGELARGAGRPILLTYYLVQNIGYTRGLEERPHEGRAPLDGAEIPLDAVAPRLVLAERRLGDALLPERVPHELVGGEVRGVAGQEVELEPAALCLDEPGHGLRPVRGVAIDGEEDRRPAAPEEGREEGEEPGRGEAPREGLVPEDLGT